MHDNIYLRAALSLVVSAILVSCSGGGGSSSNPAPASPAPPAPPPPPAGTTISISVPDDKLVPENDLFEVNFSVTTDGTAVPRIDLTSPDAALFDFVEIETRSGFTSYRLTPKTTFDFENPDDANQDNQYDISYRAVGALTLQGTFSVEITDVPSDGVVVLRNEQDELDRIEDITVLDDEGLLGLSVLKRGCSETRRWGTVIDYTSFQRNSDSWVVLGSPQAADTSIVNSLPGPWTDSSSPDTLLLPAAAEVMRLRNQLGGIEPFLLMGFYTQRSGANPDLRFRATAAIPASTVTTRPDVIDLRRPFLETGIYSTDRATPAAPFNNADPSIIDVNGDGIDDLFEATGADFVLGGRELTFVNGEAFDPSRESFFAATDLDQTEQRIVSIMAASPTEDLGHVLPADIDGRGGHDILFESIIPIGEDADHGFGILMGESIFPSNGSRLVFDNLPLDERAIVRITGLGAISRQPGVPAGHFPLVDIGGVVDYDRDGLGDVVFRFIPNAELRGADRFVYIVPGSAILGAPDRVLETTLDNLPGWRIRLPQPSVSNVTSSGQTETVSSVSVVSDLTDDQRREILVRAGSRLFVLSSAAMPVEPQDVDLGAMPPGAFAIVSNGLFGSAGVSLPLARGESDLLLRFSGVLPVNSQSAAEDFAIVVPSVRLQSAIAQNGLIDLNSLNLPPCTTDSSGRVACD